MYIGPGIIGPGGVFELKADHQRNYLPGIGGPAGTTTGAYSW